LFTLERVLVDDDGEKTLKERLIQTRGLYTTMLKRNVDQIYWLVYENVKWNSPNIMYTVKQPL
jgi:hypothetical protein